MEWAEMAFQVAVSLALVEFIKKLTGETLGHWYMLISMGVAFVVVLLSMFNDFMWLDYVRQSIIVGLAASGVFDIAKTINKG